jgi:quercetin dioxygenase-like cupin family protein
MEFFTESDFTPLRNPGVTSMQIVSPHNSQSARVTITRVTMEPGATQPRHHHQSSEQVWVALEGAGLLLLGDGATRGFKAGEVARFAEGDVHGFDNIGSAPFVYLSVTSPPINFDYAYKQKGPVSPS